MFLVCKEEAATRQREIVLFEALTQFMKKSALHSINEIVGYVSFIFFFNKIDSYR